MHNRYNTKLHTLPTVRIALFSGTSFTTGVHANAEITIVNTNILHITDAAVMNPTCVLPNANIFLMNAAACVIVSALKITKPIMTARSVYICPKTLNGVLVSFTLLFILSAFFPPTTVSMMVRIPC